MFGSGTVTQRLRGGEARDAVGADVIEDEAGLQKYDEIVEMLLAAGYFRARITALSPFDKVIGGIAWAISSAAYALDIDIDLGFEEESTIGQKIKLSENICRALHNMKCPFPLQPQQIQGLDYMKLFSVIQWLVKRVLEVREELGDTLRRFSEMQFNKTFSLPSEVERKEQQGHAQEYLGEVVEDYRPRRRYRQAPGTHLAHETEEAMVQHTLLEYGRQQKLSGRAAEKEKLDQERTEAVQQLKDAMGAADRAKTAEELEKEEARIRDVMAKLSQLDVDAGEVSSSALGGILGLQSDAVAAAAQAHEARMRELGLTDAQAQRAAQEEAHRRQVALLSNKRNVAQKRLDQTEAETVGTDAKLAKAQANVNRLLEYNKRIVDEMRKLADLETPENKAILDRLRGLLQLNEDLKKQEAEFKAECRRQMKELKAKIAEYQNQTPEQQDERIAAIKETYERESLRFQAARELLNKKNRDIAAVQRLIDSIPTRVELIGYEKRFVELYELLATNYVQTQKYYNTFNALDDVKVFLSKELSLVNSIHDNMTNVTSRAGRERFIEQLETIVGGVMQNLEKVQEKQKASTEERLTLDKKYMKLLEAQRQYYKAVKDFQMECKRNEELAAQVESEE